MQISSYAVLSLLWTGVSFGKFCNYAVNITSQSDADDIESCTSVVNITIADNFSGAVKFPQLERVTGTLQTSAKDLTSLSAPKLESVGDWIQLLKTASLKNLNLRSLESVGSFVWYASASEPSYSFRDDGITSVANITIIQTGLQSIKWLQMSSFENMYIVWNEGLDSIELPTVTNFTGNLSLSSENDMEFVLPSATAGANLKADGLGSLKIPSMKTLDDLELSENTMAKFEAPELTKAGNITVKDNHNLANLSFPKLESVSNFTYDSWDIGTNFSFPELSVVEDNAIFKSNISEFSFPSIDHIYGALNITGFNFNQTMNCAALRAEYVVYAYKFYCELIQVSQQGNTSGLAGGSESITNSTNARPISSTSNSAVGGTNSASSETGETGAAGTTDSGSSTGLSSGAKAGIAVGVIAGVAFLLGLAFMLWRRKRASKMARSDEAVEGFTGPGQDTTPSVEAGGSQVTETSGSQILEASGTQRWEAPGTRREMAAELADPHGITGRVQDRPRMELE